MYKIRLKRITNPAVIIIGKVVNLRKKLNWYESKPLFGKKILITRPRILSREFSVKLRQLGSQTYSYPLIEVVRINKLNKQDLINKIETQQISQNEYSLPFKNYFEKLIGKQEKN